MQLSKYKDLSELFLQWERAKNCLMIDMVLVVLVLFFTWEKKWWEDNKNVKFQSGNLSVAIPKGSGRVVIVGQVTKPHICLCDRLPPLLTSLKQVMPDVTVALIVSNYSLIDKRISSYHPKVIFYKVPGVHGLDYRAKLRNAFYPASVRYGHYYNFLADHPEFREIMACDDDSLILRDPFELFDRHPNDVHMMRDIFDFTVHKDWNYAWIKAWEKLDPKLKIQYGLRTSLVVSEAEFNRTIPVNGGFIIAKRGRFMKLAKLLSVYDSLYLNDAWLSDQGLLNWMILTGQLRDEGLTLFTYGSMDEVVSCPKQMRVENLQNHINISVIHGMYQMRVDFLPQEVQNLLSLSSPCTTCMSHVA